MQKILFALCLLFATAVYAQDIELDVTDTAIGEIPAVYESQKSPNLPTCNDEQLIAQTIDFLQKYNKENPVDSLYAKRNRALRLRSVRKYEEQTVEGFTSQQNRAVADKLLMTKINFSMNDSEFRICKSTSTNARFSPVYLLIYENKNGETEVQVMNYLDVQVKDLMFIFKR